jgi:hypothetical protein
MTWPLSEINCWRGLKVTVNLAQSHVARTTAGFESAFNVRPRVQALASSSQHIIIQEVPALFLIYIGSLLDLAMPDEIFVPAHTATWISLVFWCGSLIALTVYVCECRARLFPPWRMT